MCITITNFLAFFAASVASGRLVWNRTFVSNVLQRSSPSTSLGGKVNSVGVTAAGSFSATTGAITGTGTTVWRMTTSRGVWIGSGGGGTGSVGLAAASSTGAGDDDAGFHVTRTPKRNVQTGRATAATNRQSTSRK